MNVSERLADAMFSIDPEPGKVRYLNRETAPNYGLTEWDPLYKEISDMNEAKQFGLDRREYMVRKSYALEHCQVVAPFYGAPRDRWRSCYDGVMTGSRPAPPRPPSDGIDYSKYGKAIDPIDWTRVPLR